MTPELRDRVAIAEAERVYAAAYDRLAEQAQVYRLAGQPLHERKASFYAYVALRAFRAECKDAKR